MKMRTMDKERSWHLYLEAFASLLEVRTRSVGAFHFGEFYGLKYLEF